MPSDLSKGFVQRVFTILRYTQRADGVEVQIESFTLSRGVNASFRWMVMPLVRRFSQQTMTATLQQLSQRVSATERLALASSK